MNAFMNAVMRRHVFSTALIGLAAAAQWQLPVSADNAAAAMGNAAHGAQLVTTCSGCHGQQGEGMAVSGFPRLAGQSAPYLAKQLGDYASGARDNAVMASFAKALSAQDVADITAYYAGLSAPAAKPDKVDAKLLGAGRELANLGNAATGVQGCGNCHGPAGRGEPPTLPYLAGQHADYITAQLSAWQQGTRRNDSGGQMAMLSKKLSAADIAAVAAYFSQQPPPKP